MKTILKNSIVFALFLPLTALGHHSIFGRFNGNGIVELEGVVVGVTWRNPHVSFVVIATNENNEEETWEIETTSLSNLRRWNIEPNFIKAGDQIRIAGNPSIRGTNEIYAHNVLLPSGEEVLIGNDLESRWSNQTVESSPQLLADLDDITTTQTDIFHVWSTAGPPLFPETVDQNFDLNNYPLTQQARNVVSDFDRITDSPLLGCSPKGMPIIMEQPYPMEIIQQDDGSILLHLEEYDTMRTIHMANGSTRINAEPNIVGNSTARWENGSLIVTTSDINWGHFDTVGIPLSIEAETLERFTLNADGTRLDYQITVTDPNTFTEPVVLEKYWLWYPQLTVQPYDCLAR